MSKKIINADDIDEKALLASIYAKKNPDREIPKAEEDEIQDIENVKTKDSGKRKRKDSDDYRTTFLKRNELKNRRCVYISSELHEVVQKIVGLLVVMIYRSVVMLILFYGSISKLIKM